MPALSEFVDAVAAESRPEGRAADGAGEARVLAVGDDRTLPAGGAMPCYHCGTEVPAKARWHARVGGAERSFCCGGCLAIAQTIGAAGLDAFYARRTETTDRPNADPEAELRDEWSRWDDAAAQAGLVRAVDGARAQISLLLEGIHCGACIWLIESWLARQPGVVEASVNFATRRARVVWDPGETRLSDLLRAVARIGYHAYPYDPARREALAQRESRALLLRMAIAFLAMMQVMMFALPTYITVDGVEPAHRLLLEWASLTLTLPAIVYSAAPFFRGAWRDLSLLRPGMDVPVAIGLAAAFLASAWATFSGGGAVYYDSVTMFIALLLLARFVELAARRRAGDAVEGVAKARPATASRFVGWPSRDDVETVSAASLAANDIVLVRPGAVVPADGVIIEGRASVEEALLTGEFAPRTRDTGGTVLAGSIVRDGALIVEVTAAGEGTRLAAVERLVERAASERPRVALMADRFASWFVAALLLLALITALVWWNHEPDRMLAVTFAVLVVSCPCALSLATPAALAAAGGALGRHYVIVVRPDALETLARVTHVVLDKTGTLTTGQITLHETLPLRGVSQERALAIAAALEAQSEHPLAAALREAARTLARPAVFAPRVVPGHGVEGTCDGRAMRLGRPDWVAELSGRPLPAVPTRTDSTDTFVALGDASGIDALFALGDVPRPGARQLVALLRAFGIAPVLLSGDGEAAVVAMAAAVGIADARGGALPEAKRAAIAELQAKGAIVAMVGDGINDAPALAQAQVSLTLGTATPLAQWTADVVLLGDDLLHVADAIVHARRTRRVVRQNLVWALAYNAIAIPAAAFGYVTPLLAAIGMSASSLLVVANALRLSRLARRADACPPSAAYATGGVAGSAAR